MSWSARQERLAKLSLGELRDRLQAVTDDPANRRNRPGSIHIYTKRAEGKISDLVWAITAKLAENRRA